MKKVIVFAILSLSVLTVVYWLGIEVAYLYLYRTLAISFDTGLLFFYGEMGLFPSSEWNCSVFHSGYLLQPVHSTKQKGEESEARIDTV